MGFLLRSTAPLGHSYVVAPLCFILLCPATVILYLCLLFFFIVIIIVWKWWRQPGATEGNPKCPSTLLRTKMVICKVSPPAVSKGTSWDCALFFFLLPTTNCQSNFSCSACSFSFVVQMLECLVGPESNGTLKWELRSKIWKCSASLVNNISNYFCPIFTEISFNIPCTCCFHPVQHLVSLLPFRLRQREKKQPGKVRVCRL